MLNVAEKQSVAREISRFLGGGRESVRRVCNQSVSDFTLGSHLMTVTAVRGHLMETDFADPSLKNWAQTRPLSLFTERIKRSVNSREIAACLSRLAREADWLVLWLDCDREGEAICFEVIDVVCKSGGFRGQIFRAKFSALTQSDLNRAWNSLGVPNVHLSEAVLARSEIDLRIGAAFTRWLTLRFGGPGRLVSFGPCQFPTLGFVVARYLQISQFVAESFFYLKLSVKISQSATLELQWERVRLFDEVSVGVLYDLIATQRRVYVDKFSVSPTIHKRPIPLNTLDLAKFATRYLHMSSHECMRIAEQLYHKGILSYPRTETNRFHSSMDVESFVRLHVNHSVWGSYVSGQMIFTSPREGPRDDQAHPPIHPLKCVEMSQLGGQDEWKVYEFVTRHFLACCSPDATGSNTRLEVTMTHNSHIPHIHSNCIERFSATGLTVFEKYWLEIYPYSRWVSGAEIPAVSVGEYLPVHSLSVCNGTTTPPTLLSEEELIDLMDKNGIGTDATMHEHIKTVQERGYCEKTRGFFSPSPLGVGLVMGFAAYESIAYIHLAKPTLRAEMETDMSLIANGQFTRIDFIQKYVGRMTQIFQAIDDNPFYLDAAVSPRETSTAGAQRVTHTRARRASNGGRTRQTGRATNGPRRAPRAQNRGAANGGRRTRRVAPNN